MQELDETPLALTVDQDATPQLHWLTREEEPHASPPAPCYLLEQVASHSNGDHDTGNTLNHAENLAYIAVIDASCLNPGQARPAGELWCLVLRAKGLQSVSGLRRSSDASARASKNTQKTMHQPSF